MKVEIINGTRKYGDNVVFEGVDLTISSGSLVAVLGDNGQGIKGTCCGMVSHLIVMMLL